MDTNIQKLLRMPNVILTPHIAFYTNLAVQNMVEIALADVMQIIRGQTAANEI